jgi:aryl-alcohol dehydrogenase-like predicted oxidoreductase
MDHTHLGRSGLSVSRLCLGTRNFGWKTEESDAHAIMDRALAEGVNHDNLLTRHVEPRCSRHYGVGVIPWSPLAQGLLAGVLGDRAGDRRHQERNRERIEQHRPALQAYEDVCREWGSAPAAVGVAWLLHQPAVTAPIVGPRTMEQFEGSLRALDVRLDEAQPTRLDEVFPGYRAAPMEYDW